MDNDQLAFTAKHSFQILDQVSKAVKVALESEYPDSVKKSILITANATLMVELKEAADVLQEVLEYRQQKKFWQFWK